MTNFSMAGKLQDNIFLTFRKHNMLVLKSLSDFFLMGEVEDPILDPKKFFRASHREYSGMVLLGSKQLKNV